MTKQGYSLVLTLTLVALLPTFLMTGAFVTLAQTRDLRDKQVEKINFQNEPVQLTDVKAGGTVVDLRRSFRVDGDWLSNFSFTFKNMSDKPIVYLKVDLDFPETKATGNIMRYFLEYGSRPTSTSIFDGESVIKPGESISLILGPKEYKKLKAFIGDRQSLATLSKIDISLGLILFDDGTGWNSGSLVRQDPNNPRRYIPN